MKIGLIDIDYKGFPNLPLMKLAAYHKERGDSVTWYDHFSGNFDRVYVSKVFSFSPDFDEYINAREVIRGGTGYAITKKNGVEIYDKTKDPNLPAEIETQYPDYSIYPGIHDTAFGFLSRGCPRGCKFCHVAAKEGKCSYKVADLSQFWHGQKNICLSDPNILACPDWRDLLQQLAASRAQVDFNQGLDIRLLTDEKIKLLNKIRTKMIHFAWDNYKDKEIILPKLKLFKDLTKVSPSKRRVYVLVNFDTTIEQDLERIYILRELDYLPYVMIYNKSDCDSIYNRLQRWVNNVYIFKSCPRFEDYIF